MENYIVINGKRTDLTSEQLKELGIVVNENLFKRIKDSKYYFINDLSEVRCDHDTQRAVDAVRYDLANYCRDKKIMNQRALHELLSRLLWRYSMTHDGDKIDWSNDDTIKYKIYYDYDTKQFYVHDNQNHQIEGVIYFYSYDIAESEIKEIIEPFMKENPDFVW